MIRNIIVFFFLITSTVICQNQKFYFDNYTTEDGLSDNYVNCAFQDNKGWVWIGTGMGIERFDGTKFKNYCIYNDDTIEIEDILVRRFYESLSGQLYVCTEESGLAIYNRDKDRFERVKINEKPILTDVSVKYLDEDSDSNLWAATKNGVCLINFKNQTTQVYKFEKENSNSLCDNYVRKLIFDGESKLWIATINGLDKFNPDNGRFTHYSSINSLLNDDILELYLDDSLKLWIGTASNGIVILNIYTNQFSHFIPDPENERSYKINSILKDEDNKFWIGTRGGLYKYDKKTNKVTWIINDIHNKNSLAHNSVLDISVDAKGDIWVSTRGGLSYLVKEKQVFENYTEFPDNMHYLNNSEIYCIWISKSGQVWMGTESGGVNILNRENNTFRYLTEENGLSNNCIKSINSTGDGEILIGTFKGGLNVYNEKTGKIKWFKHDENDPASISDDIVWDICIDKKGAIWIGTSKGLDRYNPSTKTFVHYPEFDDMVNGVTWIGVDENNDLWLGSEIIKIYKQGEGVITSFDEKGRGIFIDSKRRYWVMTSNRGIVQYNKEKGAIKCYDEKDGLACNLSYCMLEDYTGNLWISTANGLSCFDPKNETFKNYYKINGLQGNQYNYGAALKSKNGELYFGGKHGLTIFNPKNIIENKYIPPVYITDLKIFNQSVKISNDKNAILNKSILETSILEIPYKYNVISFDFAVLNYTNNKQNKCKYMLEGFDNEWIEASGNRSATYTNLNPGQYIFKVKASNDNGYWNETGTSKILVILPPYYKQIWFKALVGILSITLLSFIFIFIFRRREMAKTYEFEKIKAQKLHELDTFKLKLFTNISHEIKTPLTLIISPLKKILKHNFKDPEVKENLLLMEKNASHLMKLVTQLLDYRKLQEGKLKIELKRGDIVRFCENLFQSFEGIMKEKGILFKFGSIQKKIYTSFDPDKLRNILNNLVSNAIKYNKQGGSVSFFISMVIEQDEEFTEKEHHYVKIEIKDTGIGIDEKEVPKIFDRYYSKAKEDEINSSGIGLAFTQELIKLHNGRIIVESHEGKGSTFTILLPYIEDSKGNVTEHKEKEVSTKDFIKTNDFKLIQKDKKILLVIEDNEDVLQFIKSHFKNKFIVLDALNGNDGLELAIKTIPDIIVSDVMMPGIDGRELCEKLKKDERTSHIPVILLTALSSNENIKEGLLKGADDYMTKPFDIDILQTKINNLFLLRKSLIKKYSKQLLTEPSYVEVKTLDEKFLEKAVKITEKYIDDPELNIDKFVSQMGVSRMQLYRKINALTSMTVKEFVNDIRLKRAEQMFAEKKISVSEVAYSVGFNDLSYFGKCFKRKYGLSPSEYNQKHVGN